LFFIAVKPSGKPLQTGKETGTVYKTKFHKIQVLGTEEYLG